jgi:hypothetical protein
MSGSKITASDQIIISDIFEGSTLDSTARWATSLSSGGTVTQTSATGCTVASSTNTAGSAILQSNAVIPYLAGSEISMRVSCKMDTVGVASNTREIGLRVDSDNYAEFRLDGTSWLTRLYSGASGFGSDYTISSPLADNLTNMDLEIRVQRNPDRIAFVYYGEEGAVQIQSYEQRGSSTRMLQGALAQVYFRTVNTGSAIDNKLTINSVLVTRRWHALPQEIRVKSLAASGLVCRGPCFYFGIRRTQGTTSNLTVYNNTTGTGTIVDENYVAAQAFTPPGPVFCHNGIYVSYASGTDAALVYYMA